MVRRMPYGKLIIVTGTPGAGKTSIIDSVKADKKYKVVNVGTIMEDIGIKRGLIKHRDEIRYLDFDTIEKFREAVFKQLASLKGNTIVDTHMSVERKGKFVPGLPRVISKYLKGLVGIVYIDATTDELLSRRGNDKMRIRETESQMILDMQRMIHAAMLAYYSIQLNIPIYVIHNEENSLKESIKAFKNALKDMTGS